MMKIRPPTVMGLLLILALSVFPATAEEVTPLEPGAEAPALALEAVLGPPLPTGGSAAPMVIEFWATWCAPCVASIPHWNSLLSRFAGEDVVFLSITDEEEGRVRAFLADRPINGRVGIDRDRSTFDDFGVTSLPIAFLVGRDGRIAATTRPEFLTDVAIRDLLHGRPPRLEPPPSGRVIVVDPGEHRADGGWPPTELAVGDAQLDEPSWAVSSEIVVADGVDPHTALAIAFDLHPRQVELADGVPQRRLQLVASEAGAGAGELRRRLRRPLLAELGAQVREERRPMKVAVLRNASGEGDRLRPADSERPFADLRSLHDAADDQPLADLLARLRDRLDMPIVDETGLGGLWDWRIEWPPSAPADSPDLEALAEVVREQLGLDLAFEARQVPILVVGPAAAVVRTRTGDGHYGELELVNDPR